MDLRKAGQHEGEGASEEDVARAEAGGEEPVHEEGTPEHTEPTSPATENVEFIAAPESSEG